MNWYLAKLVFQITSGDGAHTPQFDEQLRLMHAGSHEEAFLKGLALGKREEDQFYNSRQQLVTWRFINVSELNPINRLDDGAELYSRIEEKENAEVYIHTVNRRAEDLSAVHESAILKTA